MARSSLEARAEVTKTMRSFLMSTVVAVVVTTLAATSSADEGTAKLASPTTRPQIGRPLPVRIDGFHRPVGQQSLAYTGGALSIAVEVYNDSDKPVDNVGVKLVIGDKTLEQSVSVPPNGRRAAIFWDQAGLEQSCSPKEYKAYLTGPSTIVDTKVKDGKVTPSCTFKSNVEQTWSQMSPDKVEAMKAGNAYLASAVVLSSPACGNGPMVKAKIVNKSSIDAASLIIQQKDMAAPYQVKAQNQAAFSLAVNETKEVMLVPVAGSTKDVALKSKLTIYDWTKQMSGHTSDGGLVVNTSRSCWLTFAMD